MASWLIPAVAGKKTSYVITAPPVGTPKEDIAIIVGLIFRYFRTAASEQKTDESLLRLLFDLPKDFLTDSLALASLSTYGDLFEDIPELVDLDVDEQYSAMMRRLGTEKDEPGRVVAEPLKDVVRETNWEEISDEAARVMVSLLGEITNGIKGWDFDQARS